MPCLLHELSRHGHAERAGPLLLRKEYPGWLYAVALYHYAVEISPAPGAHGLLNAREESADSWCTQSWCTQNRISLSFDQFQEVHWRDRRDFAVAKITNITGDDILGFYILGTLILQAVFEILDFFPIQS